MPTQEQRNYLRYDLDADEDTMNDDEIDSLYTRAAARYSDEYVIEAAVRVLAVNSLLIQAAKRNDYTANRSTEKLSQIFDHLIKLRPFFVAQLSEALADNNPGVRYGQLRRSPKRIEEHPGNTDYYTGDISRRFIASDTYGESD